MKLKHAFAATSFLCFVFFIAVAMGQNVQLLNSNNTPSYWKSAAPAGTSTPGVGWVNLAGPVTTTSSGGNLSIVDPTVNTAVANVRNAAPNATDNGLVVRDVNAPAINTGVQYLATSVPTLATSANQASMAATMNALTAAFVAAVGPVTSGTAPTSAIGVGGIYRSTRPSLTTGQGNILDLDTDGNLRVTPAFDGGNQAMVAAGSNSDTVATSATNNLLRTWSLPYLINGANQFSRFRQVDALSNTATALGAVLVGPPHVINGPITFTATGQSTAVTLTDATTNAPFDQWSCQCKATGAITSYTIQAEGSVDLANYDTTTPLATASTMTADGQIFFGTGKYVRSIRLDCTAINTTGGTNVICNLLGKSF